MNFNHDYTNNNSKNDSGIIFDDIAASIKNASENSLENITLVNGDGSSDETEDQRSSAEETNVRKEGIISETVDTKPDTNELNIAVYEKDAATVELISKAIGANDFLNNMMDADRLKVVVQAMVPSQFAANSFIINEGENGNHFYVSAEGEFEVVKGGEIKKLFGPGVVFGELAILYKAKRFASIRATTDATVWTLDRKIFQKIMMRTGCQERDQNIAFLSSVPVLKDLAPDVLQKMADLLKRVSDLMTKKTKQLNTNHLAFASRNFTPRAAQSSGRAIPATSSTLYAADV